MLLCVATGRSQTAQQVLDKCAKTVSSADGVQADFVMNSAQYGDASGSISVKGKMFYASTAGAKMWFDGKTLWTYVLQNEEVNVTNPSEAQLQALNPYNFINLYKQGFTTTMTKGTGSYNVHLTATDAQRKIQEIFITVNSRTYAPMEVKMRQGTKWTTFTVSNLKATKLSNSLFSFDKTAYPDAEIIDLR